MVLAEALTPGICQIGATHGLITDRTSRAEELVIMLLAIGFSITLVETAAQEGPLAVSADKVLWVPPFAQRLDILPRDRSATTCTPWAEELMIALLVIRSSRPRKETFPSDDPTTTSATKTRLVPCLVECLNVGA